MKKMTKATLVCVAGTLLASVAVPAQAGDIAGDSPAVTNSAAAAGQPQSWPWPWPWPTPTPTPTPTPEPTATPTATVAPTPTPEPSNRPEWLRGRKAVDHVHTDAVSVVWENGGLVIKSKVGSTNVDTSSVYFNLQQDFYEGIDVSKLVIPTGEDAKPLAYLGEPGDVLWAAPGKYYPGWKPIWAGFAAEVPRDKIEQGTLRLELVRAEGPSWVENITYHGPGRTHHRRMSSRDKSFEGRTHRMHYNNYHFHSTWVFGKPGTYKIVYKISGQTPEGKRVESQETDVVWQVGPLG